MTRIIAGSVGSLQLKAAAKATRPTSDRVKESLFAKLDSMGVIEDSSVLDLFAGTGALGLECASRGAKSVMLNEWDPAAFSVLKGNLELVRLALGKQKIETALSVHRLDALKFLRKTEATFDLVFLDPPYGFRNEELLECLSIVAERLNSDALIVIERSSRGEYLPTIEKAKEISRKVYGDTTVFILQAS